MKKNILIIVLIAALSAIIFQNCNFLGKNRNCERLIAECDSTILRLRNENDSLRVMTEAQDYAFYKMTKSKMQYIPAQHALVGCYEGLAMLACTYIDSLRNSRNLESKRRRK